MNDKEKKSYAALSYALGWTRGMLGDVLEGNASPERLRQVYDASAVANIAKAIGISETDMLFVDWDAYLTTPEKWTISGRVDNDQ